MKREAAVAALASEGLALVAGSAGAGNSAVALYLFNFIQCLDHRLLSDFRPHRLPVRIRTDRY